MERAGRGHGFDAAGPDFRGQGEGADDLTEEGGLFILGFGERDVNVRAKESDGEAREAGPGAEVQKCESAGGRVAGIQVRGIQVRGIQVTRGEETLAEVAADDLFGIADGGQVGARIPFEEETEVSREPWEKSDREVGKIRLQEIGYGGL
jgi:hypothetical protein